MSNINKSLLSRNLKIVMATKDLNVHELSEKSGVAKHQIDNIIYKRACTEETLEKLCKALDIAKSSILSSTPIDISYYDFDIDNYNMLASYVNEFTKKINIKIDKLQMDSIINTVYKRQFPNKKEAVNAIMYYLTDQGELEKKIKDE